MIASKMVEEKLLHKQYLTDELGNKSSIVLPMNEFQDLLDDIDDLAGLGDDGGPQTGKSSGRAEKQVSEQQIEQLKYYHTRFEKVIIKLHEYKNLKVELKRQLLLQEMMEDVDKELQRIRYQLAQLKKDIKPANLYNVPVLPNNAVINNTLFSQIKQQILTDYKEERPPILLSAPVGMGKSVLAATLARDSAIRTAYPDGIFWVSMGKEPDILTRLTFISHGLDDKKLWFVDPEAAGERIKRLTATQTCLVIFDDAIDPQDILSFNVLGQYGQILITTSEDNFFDILKYFLPKTALFNLEPFSPEHAVNYFMQQVGNKVKREDVPIKLDSLAKLCQHSPSLLAYVANIIKHCGLDEWKEVARNLQNTDFEFPEKYPHILMQALFMNVDDLGEEGEYYSSLSVFGDYTRIPLVAIKVLWKYLYQMSNEDVENFLAELASRNMLQIRESSSLGKVISLHSYQYEFAYAESEIDKLHNHLLVAYRRLCDQHGWISGPNDGYFFQYLSMHLYNANRKGELKSLLLDLDWILNKLKIAPLHAVLMDYDWFEEDEDINMVRTALYEGASSLLTQQTQDELASQILNHLWDKVPDTNKDLQSLIHQSKEAAPDWKWVEPFPEELMGSTR
ncbi:MAG: NB-ARC domain-containing protein [Thiotrichaceae bacterium]|nr:NB-ARC domain-containing protein [Thiotrichaceae bacterium]